MNKPSGRWKCRACGWIWPGSFLYEDPNSTAARWTCGNLFCGGTCDPLQLEPAPFVVFPTLGYWEIDGKPVSEQEAHHSTNPRAVWKPTEIALS